MFEKESSELNTEEMNRHYESVCKSGADVFKQFCSQMLPPADKEELSEDDLEFVMGGMSDMQALEVISTAYWDLCVKKKGSTKYSKTQIYEALNRCHGMNRRNQNSFTDIGKVTSLLLREMNS